MPVVVSTLEVGAATHAGKVRQQNEDNYLVLNDHGMWAVADGMGGHLAGHFASRLIVEELSSVPRPSSAAELLASCEARVVSANSRLREFADDQGEGVVGSTLAVLLVFESFYAAVWSGDSRIYLICRDQIEQITLDHTEVQELISDGTLTAEEAREWPRRNVVTRAIGVHDEPELEMKSGVLEPGDMFIICSDGLTAHVEDREILALARQHRPQSLCDQLVTLTLDRGATDNVTVVAVRFTTASRDATLPVSMRPRTAEWE